MVSFNAIDAIVVSQKAKKRKRVSKRKPKLLPRTFPENSSILFTLRWNRNVSVAKLDKKLTIY